MEKNWQNFRFRLFQACQKSPGCTAFDLVESKGKKKPPSCLLYGHTRVIPASRASPFPATCHKMVDEDSEEDIDPTDLVGNIEVKLIGKGACRYVLIGCASG